MREDERDIRRDGPPECANEAMRDALPSLEHGRLTLPERRLVEAHLQDCGACVAELALLRDARQLFGRGTPALDLDRIAAAVAGATRPMPTADVIPIGSRAPSRTAVPAAPRRGWATRLAGGSGLRAAAAAIVVALGAGAFIVGRQGADERVPAQGAPLAVAAGVGGPEGSVPMAAAQRTGALSASGTDAGRAGAGQLAQADAPAPHALGERFTDLDDAELDAVLQAIEGEDASLPALEPVVLAPEYRGGGE